MHDLCRISRAARVAAVLWAAAAGLYLAIEGLAAAAYSPPYDYARNYISDLGVPACGTLFEGRAICSPLAWLMNAGFAVQGLLFFAAAAVMARSLASRPGHVLAAVAALNLLGNVLIAAFPESDPRTVAGALTVHVLGAILAIVFGNATALVSTAAFRDLRLPRFHRRASLTLPLLATAALATLAVARTMGPTSPASIVPPGALERVSVYTITAWELLTAACLLARRRG